MTDWVINLCANALRTQRRRLFFVVVVVRSLEWRQGQSGSKMADWDISSLFFFVFLFFCMCDGEGTAIVFCCVFGAFFFFFKQPFVGQMTANPRVISCIRKRVCRGGRWSRGGAGSTLRQRETLEEKFGRRPVPSVACYTTIRGK